MRWLLHRLRGVDDGLARRLNLLGRCWPPGGRLVGLGASHLASVDVGLMGVLALTGRPRAALRMLLAVALVYAASELAGQAWPRPRPFTRLEAVTPLAPHTPGRSFPSRHVASAVAMALIAAHHRPALGRALAGNALVLSLLRVAAGLHYPSDVLAGLLLGVLVAIPLRGRS
ncbi:MAG: phosphatase PAP2 family protein [Chloroflexi bacterium]|nr:phosphatase PAP2 family protein [Chloroflexota bacterium]